MSGLTRLELDVLGLSSGTLASLTGEREYDRLDAIRREFFAQTRQAIQDGRLDAAATWIEAWRLFDRVMGAES